MAEMDRRAAQCQAISLVSHETSIEASWDEPEQATNRKLSS
jgi:hypothetical protein